jgi:hypothetical protein
MNSLLGVAAAKSRDASARLVEANDFGGHRSLSQHG